MGELLVLDGLDGSGKATQTALLADWLRGKGCALRQLTFPNYQSRSSELVKMYLAGEISQDPNAVNAYAAASFYACDRYINYKTDWEQDYLADTLILCDRYVSSNAVHQMVKLDQSEWEGFLLWLDDYEYNKLGLPRPDQVLYLDMQPDVSQHLLRRRYTGDESRMDIHESNVSYLLHCRTAALFAAKRLGWTIIPCSDQQQPYPIEQIAQQIQQAIGV